MGRETEDTLSSLDREIDSKAAAIQESSSTLNEKFLKAGSVTGDTLCVWNCQFRYYMQTTIDGKRGGKTENQRRAICTGDSRAQGDCHITFSIKMTDKRRGTRPSRDQT